MRQACFSSFYPGRWLRRLLRSPPQWARTCLPRNASGCVRGAGWPRFPIGCPEAGGHCSLWALGCQACNPSAFSLVFFWCQLGFGSFLGIIGINLVENRKQMVRMCIVSFNCGSWGCTRGGGECCPSSCGVPGKAPAPIQHPQGQCPASQAVDCTPQDSGLSGCRSHLRLSEHRPWDCRVHSTTSRGVLAAKVGPRDGVGWECWQLV